MNTHLFIVQMISTIFFIMCGLTMSGMAKVTSVYNTPAPATPCPSSYYPEILSNVFRKSDFVTKFETIFCASNYHGTGGKWLFLIGKTLENTLFQE
jgi:hypothetical protein